MMETLLLLMKGGAKMMLTRRPRAVLHGFRDSFEGRSSRLKLFFGGDEPKRYCYAGWTAEFWNPSGNSKSFELWWCRGDSGCGYLKQDGVINDFSIKVIQEDFSMRVPKDLSLKDLIEDFGMRRMSDLSRKDLLEDFEARARGDLNVKVIFKDPRILQACRGLEVNVLIHLLALRIWLLSRSSQAETFVHE
ncbi:hypothetical protein AK812_SmicGene27150 [Symbiodinium microadriaticum]|uniref:Uncharacterized protein n=1 Tax=Symbiodinium microadriaticum TaxID=2951 RepID=A0A1Q9D7T0_SYMMI|nr:hypothetical protein AK812_SmicGene27150 [Symbiodinium microadriaticum]